MQAVLTVWSALGDSDSTIYLHLQIIQKMVIENVKAYNILTAKLK